MTTTRKPADSRKKDLELALLRIQRGRSRSGETRITIAAVAREAGVSTALIHNHYPGIAEAIRDAQGRSSRVQREVKHQDLIAEREKNTLLRDERQKLLVKIADLASLNEMLAAENRELRANQSVSNLTILHPKDS
ncbi:MULTISPECIES: TetR family transcriptional regulator [Pseudomonas syringae group]|uniref:TetR family transcriptional regulator n=1 Tax=Pseudomonas syringae TaxID=317 RepID=A0A244ELJ0_PSESX|nr:MULTISPECIES: TetR family transcriptional regulator [Pseudomonas syringae group]OUM05343.1 TetR family transcriptional regulator [Pseudomonas syringae]